MKKLIYAFGIVAFLTLGSYAVDSVIMTGSTTDTSVFDDPPAKKKGSKHSCCSEYGKKDDCSTKSSHSKADCDTKGKSDKKASTTTTKKSNETTPDKK